MELVWVETGCSRSGFFFMITFEDASGTSHSIRRSLTKPLLPLDTGDKVEVNLFSSQPDQVVENTRDKC